MIAEELRRLGCAIQFLTLLPVPAVRHWPEDRLARAARYFPLAGLAVGALAAAVLLVAARIWPAGALPALLAVSVGVLVTGGLHEAGLADTADGLGGGRTREQRLAIMKDSRLGSYGALALGLALALRVSALAALAPAAVAGALLSAHALGRAAAVVVMAATPYAADPQASKLRGAARGVAGWEAALATGVGAAPLLLLPPPLAWAGVLAGALAGGGIALAALRLIGGHTGDTLGAVEQAFETGFLVGAAAAWALASGGP